MQTRKAGASHQIDQRSRSTVARGLDQTNPKLLQDPQFLFNDFYVKSSSHYYGLVHILPASSSKSAPTRIFLRFSCEIELSLKSRAHFSNPIFQKSSERLSFYNFYVKSSSRYSPVHFSSTTFADRGWHPRKQRAYLGEHGSHFTRKTQGFAPESLSSLKSRVPELSHFPTHLVDMIMWLT